MDQETTEQGVLTVLLERLEKQTLPRLFDMQARLGRGETLNDADLTFLEESMQEARKTETLVIDHLEYQSLAGKLVDLYKEITDKALANQARASA